MPDQWSFRTYMVYIYPVLDVRKYCHGFMDKVGYYYRMSSSYYYSYGDGDSIIVEVNEQPQEFISVRKYDEVDFVRNDESQGSSYSGKTRHAISLNSVQIVSLTVEVLVTGALVTFKPRYNIKEQVPFSSSHICCDASSENFCANQSMSPLIIDPVIVMACVLD